MKGRPKGSRDRQPRKTGRPPTIRHRPPGSGRKKLLEQPRSLTVRIEGWLLDSLRARAQQEGITLGAYVRRIFGEEVETPEDRWSDQIP